jgi:predicted Zn-dependent protease
VLNNPKAKQYLQSMIDKIIASKDVKYRGTFPYKVEVLDDDKTVNAFCTPGGYIYVYTGLIKMLDNEASLAGVLGHEIAHAERRHSTSRMTKAMGVQAATELALGKNPNSNVALAANAFTGLGLLKNGRDDEDEADEYSFKYLQSTKWYPGAILYFFEKVKGRGGSSLEELFSTHPLPESRLENTKKRLKEANIPPPTEAQLNTKAYQDFKRSL